MRKAKINLNGSDYLVYEDGRGYSPSGKEIKQRLNHDGY